VRNLRGVVKVSLVGSISWRRISRFWRLVIARLGSRGIFQDSNEKNWRKKGSSKKKD